jgi:Phage integrase, N-terminal SAM-like domain
MILERVTVGFARKRVDGDGRVRWTAVYRDLRGRIRSAGTFTTEKLADKAWQRAEVHVAEGRAGDPRRGRQRFRQYVEHEWLPYHAMEPSTRQGYTYSIKKHIIPYFGKARMIDIVPSDVREWITELKASGVAPATIKKPQEHPERDLHDRAQRPGDLHPPLQGRQDTDGPDQAPEDHRARPVRRHLRVAAV